MVERQVVVLKVAGSSPVTHPIFFLDGKIEHRIMLKNHEKERAPECFGAQALDVRARRFRNSAAKFWSALVDELMSEYPGCARVALEAVNEGRLDPGLLFPEIELERELQRSDLSRAGINAAWRKVVADFELYGPPGSVNLRVYAPSGEQSRLALPMDCVDAEIFLYLLAWLLEWSDLPLNAWNEPEIKSSFSAVDPGRKFNYRFDFMLGHKPLSEGLFSWRLDLNFERSPEKCAPPGALRPEVAGLAEAGKGK